MAQDQATIYYKLDLSAPVAEDRMQEHTAKISQFEDVSIALVGPSVAGKSALINTFASYLSNRLELLAACKSGITQHVLRCSDGNPLRWKMLEPQGALIDDLIGQQQAACAPHDADRHVSTHDVHQFVEDKVLQPLASAGVGCIACAVPATMAELNDKASLQGRTLEPCKDSQLFYYLQALKQLNRQAARSGMHVICMITQIDEYDSKVVGNVAEVAHSHSVHMLRRCISQHTLLPLNQVFPVVALVDDICPSNNPALGHLCLFPLLVALRAASNVSSNGASTAICTHSDAHRRKLTVHDSSVHWEHQQESDYPTAAFSNTPSSCQQELLASASRDVISFAPAAITVDCGFGRMRGGEGNSPVGTACDRSTHAAIHDARNADVQIYINGQFFHRSEAKISVFDSGFLVGDGIWEGMRLHHGKFAFLDRHLARIHSAAKTTDIPIPSTEELTTALYATIERNNMHDSVHARLMITRGNKKTPSQHPANLISGPNVIIIAEHKRADSEAVASGLTLFTSTIRRPPPDTLDQRLNCHSKLHEVIALIQAVKAGADEALMLDPTGSVATCNATNFFIVTGGTVVTSTGLYNLHGITREMVLEVCKTAGIPIEKRQFSLLDVYSADEAFATGTFGGLTAVAEVDGRSIGTAIPGPMTQRLQRLYTEAVAADVGREESS